MTRETKIGLLVSLAFVIAVGVLLSDHMVNNTDAKPIEVAKAGPDVAKGLAVPGQAAEGVNIPVTSEANPAPVQTVPSVGDITAPPGRRGQDQRRCRPAACDRRPDRDRGHAECPPAADRDPHRSAG